MERKLPVGLGEQASFAKFMHRVDPLRYASPETLGSGESQSSGQVALGGGHTTAEAIGGIGVNGLHQYMVVVLQGGNRSLEDLRRAPSFLQKKMHLELAAAEWQIGKSLESKWIVEVLSETVRRARHRILRRFAGQAIFDLVDPPQLVREQFVPSDRLTAYVASAIARMKRDKQLQERLLSSTRTINSDLLITSHLDALEPSEDRQQVVEEARRMISRNVKLVLSAIGARRSTESGTVRTTIPITQQGRFADFVSAAILEVIPVNIYHAKLFLEQLYEELVPVARSQVYGGTWGKLGLVDSELALLVTPRPRKLRGKWTRAKAVGRRKS